MRTEPLVVAALALLLLVPIVTAAPHDDAKDTADKLQKAINSVSLPYENELTIAQIGQLGYTTSTLFRQYGTYKVSIKSASYNSDTGILTTYFNAWHNSSSLRIRNPVHWYMPMSIGGGNNNQRLQTFVKMLISHIDSQPYGQPENDDTLILYPTVDGYVWDTTDGTWQSLRDAAGDGASSGQTAIQTVRNLLGTTTENQYAEINRGIFSFNTSSIGDSDTIDSWTFSLYTNGADSSQNGVPRIGVTGGTLASATAIAAGDYDGFASTNLTDTVILENAWATTNNFTSNAAGNSYVNKTGFTVLFVRDSWDINNAYTGVWYSSGFNYWTFYPVGYATEAQRPRLTITYTPGGGSAPVAAYSANTTSGYPPFDIAFTDSSTNTPTGWAWLFGDGDTASTQNPIHTYDSWIGNTLTKYTVNLTASNAFGSDAENKTEYIWAYPLNASFTPNATSGCAPLHVGFTDATWNGTPSAWDWNFGGDGTANTPNATHVFTTPGTYWVSLNASNSYSFDSENRTGLITVTSGTVAGFSANQTSGNAPLHVGFTDSSVGTGITNWTWDFENDGNPDSYEQNPSHVYGSTGTYTVNLTVTGTCRTDSEVKTDYITVSENAPVAGFSANATSGCANLHVKFTDSSTGTITNWSWDFQNDGTPDSYEQNPVAIFGAGTFTINLTVTSAFGTDSEMKTNYITAGSATVSADFSVDDTTPVAGQEIHFTDESTGGPTAWAWSWGDGTANGTTQNLAHTYSSPGNYTVNLTATNPCGGSDTEQKVNYIIVGEAPTPTPTPAEAQETSVGETWIKWVWEDLGTTFDLYIDGIPKLFNVTNTTTSYRLTGLNPSEKHILGLYNNSSGELLLEEDATTLPATWFLASILGISIVFGIFTIFTRDAFRALMTSSISCVTSAFLVMISVGHSWGFSILAIIVAVITGVVVALILLDIRYGSDEE